MKQASGVDVSQIQICWGSCYVVKFVGPPGRPIIHQIPNIHVIEGLPQWTSWKSTSPDLITAKLTSYWSNQSPSPNTNEDQSAICNQKNKIECLSKLQTSSWCVDVGHLRLQQPAHLVTKCALFTACTIKLLRLSTRPKEASSPEYL